jgi:predicted double-glycine peptidase
MMRILRRGLWALLIAIILFPGGLMASGDDAGEMNIAVGGGFGRFTIKPRVKPLAYFKDRNVIKQGLDFSCGAAAAATIFNFYLGETVTEMLVIETMFKAGDVDKILERQGFSLLDIKRFAEALGHRAAGYKTDVAGLLTLNRPSIVAIVLKDYRHFVVFRGIENGKVFVADPALGNTTLSLGEFEEMWYGQIALVIEPKDGSVKNGLKITDEDRFIVGSDGVRSMIYQNPVFFGKGAREF